MSEDIYPHPVPPEKLEPLSAAEVGEKLRKRAEQAVLASINTLDPDAVARAVISDLNKAKLQVVFKILGIEKEYRGPYRVSSGTRELSPMAQWLAEKCRPAIEGWLESATNEVFTHERYEEARRGVADELRRHVDAKMRDTRYDDKIRTAAQRYVDTVRDKVVEEMVTGRTQE